MRFWDASALVPLCLDDPSTKLIRGVVREDVVMAVWWGTPVECFSAFTRLRRQGELDATGWGRARDLLDRLAEDWSEVGASLEVREQAIRLLGLHPLRAADALQLAAGLVWTNRRPASQAFVCLDARLREAAQAEGFTVLPA